MDRIASQTAYDAEPIDPTAETIINGAPYIARPTALADDQPQSGLSEEIKRRQIALAVRYVEITRGAMR